jgi:hypothetical protein
VSVRERAAALGRAPRSPHGRWVGHSRSIRSARRWAVIVGSGDSA